MSDLSLLLVCLGSAWGQLCVLHSRSEADPEQTQKADPEFGCGLLSVRLGLVGIVVTSNKTNSSYYIKLH